MRASTDSKGMEKVDTQRPSVTAFTLIEMLLVLAIIGILAGMTLPALKNLGKGNLKAAAVRQLMDDLSYARLKAMSGRTEVYLAFMPDHDYLVNLRAQNAEENFPAGSSLPNGTNTVSEVNTFFYNNYAANALLGKQLSSYVIFTRHSVGDQPGESSPRYLSDWQTLPENIFIPASVLRNHKIFLNPGRLNGVAVSTDTPIPLADPNGSSRISYFLPMIGFDSEGRLIANPFFDQRDAHNQSITGLRIPIQQGSVFHTSNNGTNNTQNADAVDTTEPVQSGELIPGQFYVVSANGNSTNHIVRYGTAVTLTDRDHYPGDVFQATTAAGTNYQVRAGSPKVTLFAGVQVDYLTGRTKVMRAR